MIMGHVGDTAFLQGQKITTFGAFDPMADNGVSG